MFWLILCILVDEQKKDLSSFHKIEAVYGLIKYYESGSWWKKKDWETLLCNIIYCIAKSQ